MKCPPPQPVACRVLLVTAVTASIILHFHTLAASLDDHWDPTLGVPGADGTIWTIVRHGSDLYVGGSFNQVGGVFATNIAKWDGTNWSALGFGLSGSLLPEIHALVFIGEDLYAGGFFTQAGTAASQGVAKWDGTNWSTLAGGVSGGVRALAVSQGKLITGGTFSTAGNIDTPNIAAWDGTNWSVLSGGIPGEAVDSLSATGTTIYAGGRFRVGAGINATNVARWNGTSWSGLGEGIRGWDQAGGGGGMVRTLLVTSNGIFAAGSGFGLAGKTNAANIARWDGSNWWALGSGVDASGGVYALALNGADLYVAGFFGSAGGIAANAIARWDGNHWSGLGSGLIYPPGPGSLKALVSTGSELVVAGGFKAAGGKSATNIAVWHIPHALSVSCTEETVTLSWPATGTNFVLERKESVAETNWSVISTQPALVLDELRVTNQINSPARFFRLRRK